jgi:hypothetical protein
MTPSDSDSTSSVVISSDESKILNALIRPEAKLEVIVPHEASAEDLWNTLSICIKGVNYMNSRIRRLSPIIGRILCRFEDRPSLYKELGYQTFSDFKWKGVSDGLGIGRSFLYESMVLARQWPQVTPERFERIGPKKMRILEKITDGKSSRAEELLCKAETLKVTELRHWAEEKGDLMVDESVGRTIEIPATLATYRRWWDFKRTPEVQAYVGPPADPDKILNALMDEAFNSWMIEGAGIIAKAKEKEDDATRDVDVHNSNTSEPED